MLAQERGAIENIAAELKTGTVCESWPKAIPGFQYPLLLKDTIDQLIDRDNFQYAIYGLSEAGDLLSNIVREDEISEAIERENPDVLLISGGGNDMVGNGRMD